MPIIPLQDESSSDSDEVENTNLYLPSQLSLSMRSGCANGLPKVELQLRLAQAGDSLDKLRQFLCIYSSLVAYKIKNLSGPGQKANTRARGLLSRFMTKVHRCADRYRAAHQALESLEPAGAWTYFFRPLLAGDIRGPSGVGVDVSEESGIPPASLGEGRRDLSWLWKSKRSWHHLIGSAGESHNESLTGSINEEDLSPCSCSCLFPRFVLILL